MLGQPFTSLRATILDPEEFKAQDIRDINVVPISSGGEVIPSYSCPLPSDSPFTRLNLPLSTQIDDGTTQSPYKKPSRDNLDRVLILICNNRQALASR